MARHHHVAPDAQRLVDEHQAGGTGPDGDHVHSQTLGQPLLQLRDSRTIGELPGFERIAELGNDTVDVVERRSHQRQAFRKGGRTAVGSELTSHGCGSTVGRSSGSAKRFGFLLARGPMQRNTSNNG